MRKKETLIMQSEKVSDTIEEYLEDKNEIVEEICEMNSSRSSDNKIKSPHPPDSMSATKIELSFSVDRLLRKIPAEEQHSFEIDFKKCCDDCSVSCVSDHPICILDSNIAERTITKLCQNISLESNEKLGEVHPSISQTLPFVNRTSKCVVRPLPTRALCGNNYNNATSQCLPFSTLSTSTFFRLHHLQEKPLFPQQHSPLSTTTSTTSALNIASPHLRMTPLNCNLKSIKSISETNATLMLTHPNPPATLGHFPKPKIPTTTGHYHPPLLHQHLMLSHMQLQNSNVSMNNNNNNSSNNNSNSNNGIHRASNNNDISNNGKRKRSWSRAVFSNLQRKGLEIQFQQQKYITKPDRRKLAARLNLTDAQVKVWFQNRRMKWRHTRENLKSGQEKQHSFPFEEGVKHQIDYSSEDSDCSMNTNDNEDYGEIDVVE